MSEPYEAPAPELREASAVMVEPPLPDIRIQVYGRPAPQGSKAHVGEGRMVESSPHLKPWRDAVRTYATTARNRIRGWQMLTGPIEAAVTFTLARPASHYRTGSRALDLTERAPSRPYGVPDLSKLIRSTEDALTDARIWGDDKLVVGYRLLAKHYTTDHGWVPDVLDKPGCVIRLWMLERPGGDR